MVEVGSRPRTSDEVLIALASASLLVEVREVRWAFLLHALAFAALSVEVRSGKLATFVRLFAFARAGIWVEVEVHWALEWIARAFASGEVEVRLVWRAFLLVVALALAKLLVKEWSFGWALCSSCSGIAEAVARFSVPVWERTNAHGPPLCFVTEARARVEREVGFVAGTEVSASVALTLAGI